MNGECECPLGYTGVNCQLYAGLGGNSSGYNCELGNCNVTNSNAEYSTLTDCETACGGGNSSGYNCESGNCNATNTNAEFPTLTACEVACGSNTPSFYSSTIHSYSGDATCEFAVGPSFELIDPSTTWKLTFHHELGGTLSEFSADRWGPDGDWMDPYLILRLGSSTSNYYVSVDGYGNWSDNTFTFSATLAPYDDAANESIGTTYEITGVIYCQ